MYCFLSIFFDSDRQLLDKGIITSNIDSHPVRENQDRVRSFFEFRPPMRAGSGCKGADLFSTLFLSTTASSLSIDLFVQRSIFPTLPLSNSPTILLANWWTNRLTNGPKS